MRSCVRAVRWNRSCRRRRRHHRSWTSAQPRRSCRSWAPPSSDELGAISDPSRRVIEALALLEGVPELLASGRPWPGDLERIKLGAGAALLKTQVCNDYRAALEELAEMSAQLFAVSIRAAFDEFLREYGSRYTALKREQLGARLLRSRAARTRSAAHARDRQPLPRAVRPCDGRRDAGHQQRSARTDRSRRRARPVHGR